MICLAMREVLYVVSLPIRLRGFDSRDPLYSDVGFDKSTFALVSTPE